MPRGLVAVGEEHDALGGILGGGLQLALRRPKRLRNVSGRGDAGIVQASGVQGLTGRGLHEGVLRKGDYANLVYRLHALGSIREILFDERMRALANAARRVHQEDDSERFPFSNDLEACQHQNEQGREQTAHDEGNALSAAAHIGDGLAVQPPEIHQNRWKQKQVGPVGKLYRHVGASSLQSWKTCCPPCGYAARSRENLHADARALPAYLLYGQTRSNGITTLRTFTHYLMNKPRTQ